MSVTTKIKAPTNGFLEEPRTGTPDELEPPVQVRVALVGACEPRRLREVWSAVLETNEAARGAALNGHGSNGNGVQGGVNGNGKSSGHKAVRFAWQEFDLRGLTSQETQTWIDSFLETDRNQKLLASRGPSMRCAVIRVNEEAGELIWSLHPKLTEHIGVSGVIGEVAEAYGESLEFKHLQTTGDHEVPTGKENQNGRVEPKKDQPGNGTATAVVTKRAGSGDEIEEQLTSVWQVVLKTTGIGADDDFFDLGGHSLLAARLLARIEQAMGVELALASLLDAPTIRGQARLIRKERAATNQSRTEKRKASELPFFYLGGDPTFRPLSRRLSELREFHSLGLQPSVVGKLKKRTLEVIAEQMVLMIRERRPNGPYMLGGWCAHGLLAYEVARQLKVQGQEVAEVLMLETVNPVRMNQYSGWRRIVARIQLKVHLLKFESAYLRELNREQKKDYLATRASQKIARIKQSLREMLGQTAETEQGPLDVLYAAASRYYPKPYDGHVVLIRSVERAFGFGRQLDLGWTDVLGEELEICETPGNHYTIYLEPNVDTLARKMDGYLRRAEERATKQANAGVAS